MSNARRDLGLDVLRFTALALMVSTHYFQRLPSPTALTELVNFLGESAAVMFFFAFGLTFDRFHTKSRAEKLDANLLFLYVALFHNLFLWGKLTTVDFLGFLFLCRIVLGTMQGLRRERALWLAGSAVVLLLALALPEKGVIDRVFMKVIGGLFPLLPWGVFVVLGAAYARSKPTRLGGVAMGLGAVALALALGWVGATSGRSSFQISKWPLTTPYILLFTGVSVLILEGARSVSGLLRRVPALAAPVVFYSRNLLLGAVLQYLPLELLFWMGPSVGILHPAEGDEAAVLLAIVAGSTLCLALLAALVPLVIRVWERAAVGRLLGSLRAHRDGVAVLALVVCGVLCTKPVRESLAAADLSMLGKWLSGAAMIYFALELRQLQHRGRSHLRRTDVPPSLGDLQ